MRPQQNRRMRGRGNNNNNNNRRSPNPLTRNYESNGPDVKIRGNAQHIAEKYTALARDAQASGDRVIAENYLQHAEHYNRIIMSAQAQIPQPAVREDDSEGDDFNSDNVGAVEYSREAEETLEPSPASVTTPEEQSSANVGMDGKEKRPNRRRISDRRRDSTAVDGARQRDEGEIDDGVSQSETIDPSNKADKETVSKEGGALKSVARTKRAALTADGSEIGDVKPRRGRKTKVPVEEV